MNAFHEQFSVWFEEYKVQQGWNKPRIPRPAPKRPVLTEEQENQYWNEIEVLRADFDPDYEYALDHDTYEKGKRTADRIRFLLSLLGLA